MSVETLRNRILTLPGLFLFIIIILPLWSSIPGVFAFGAAIYMLWLIMLNRALKREKMMAQQLPRAINLLYDLILVSCLLYLGFSFYKYNLDIPDKHFYLFGILTLGLVFALFVVSRNLVVAESANDFKYSIFFKTLLWFYFLPIGIFFLQPRIIKCLREKQSLESSTE